MEASISCPSCGTVNPGSAKFCMSCGAGLGANCPNCGAESPPSAKFCIECGTALGEGAAAPTPTPTTAEPPPEERRVATVLFADLSGSTAATEHMDPEAAKALIDSTLRRL